MKELSNKHQIKSLLFDLVFDDETRAQELYNDVHQLHYQELERVISRCLDEFVGAGAFAQVKTLELDLGAIYYDDLQKELPQRIYESLSKRLSELFSEGNQKEQPMIINEVRSKIDLVRYFLLEGYLPWSTKESIDSLLDSILSAEPKALATLLRKIGNSSRVRQRIIYRFSSSAIEQIVKTLFPQNNHLIIQFHQLLTEWGSQKSQMNWSQDKLSKEAWQWILDYTLLQPQQNVPIHSLFREVLIQFSEKNQLTFSQLFLQLSEEINQYQKKEYLGIKATFSEVSKVLNLSRVTKQRMVHSFSHLPVEERTRILFQFLQTRSIDPKIEGLKPALLQQHFVELLRIEPVALIDFLREPSQPAIAINSVVDRFSVKTIHELIRTIEPSHYKAVVSYQNNLVLVHQKERLVFVSEKSLSGSLWKMILQLLLVKSGSYFNQKSFLRMLIARISAHYNIDYSELVSQLYKMVFKVSVDSSRMPQFIQLIKEIYEEEVPLAKEALLPELKGKAKQNESLEIAEQQEKEKVQQREAQLAFLQILRQYLIKGTTVKSLSSLRTLFLRGLKIQPEEVLEALRNPVVFPASVQRIVRDFDEQLIKELVKVIEPNHYQSVFHFQRHLIHLQKTEPVIRTSETELSDALWSLILQVLLFRPASHFNQKSFLKNLLLQTAAHYNTDYFDLVGQLCKTAKLVQSKSTTFQSFIRLIQEIQAEEDVRRTLKEEEELKSKIGSNKKKKEEVLAKKAFDPSRGGMLPTSLMKLLFQSTADPSPELKAYGFINVAEAIQYLSTYHQSVLITQLKKYGIPELTKFIRQLPVTLLSIILRQLSPAHSEKIDYLLDTLNRQLHQIGFVQRLSLLSALREQSFFFLLQQPAAPLNQLLLNLEEVLAQYDLPAALYEFRAQWQIPAKGNLDANLQLMEIHINRELEEKQNLDSKNLELLKTIVESKQSYSYTNTKEKEMEVEKEIYISNAGLVILNAYVHFFFQRCGLLGDDGFESREAAQRAALLLQYVFDPKAKDYPEETMALNKIICGLPLHETLPTSFEATEQEVNTTAHMLDAIISHWKIISNSSHEGFRESWLQREGKLTKKEKYWELVVEKRAFDVLLDYKPFTLSPVSFSWMNKPIKVEWR